MLHNINAMLNMPEPFKLTQGTMTKPLSDKKKALLDLFDKSNSLTSKELRTAGVKVPGIEFKSLIYFGLVEYEAINNRGGIYTKL